jgi:hypothetical protein
VRWREGDLTQDEGLRYFVPFAHSPSERARNKLLSLPVIGYSRS